MGQDFGVFYVQVYVVVFNGGEGGLCDVCGGGQVVLVYFLQFMQYLDGFVDGDFDIFFCFMIFIYFIVFCNCGE